MRNPTLFIFDICLVFVSGCVTRGPDVLFRGSDAEISAEALRMAQADIATGHPKICYAGTTGVSPIGIPVESFGLVGDLPRLSLPCGCTEPLARPAMHFAQVYNTEVLRYLREQKK